MGYVAPINPMGRRIWTAPIVEWSADDKLDHIAREELPTNEVVRTLCMSGECLCGAFAEPEEIAVIEAAYPKVARRIHDLEVKAKAAGVHCKWGTRPPVEPGPLVEMMEQPMCHSCNAKRELS